MQTAIYIVQYLDPNRGDRWINDEAFPTRIEAQQHVEKEFSGFKDYKFNIDCIVFNQ